MQFCTTDLQVSPCDAQEGHFVTAIQFYETMRVAAKAAMVRRRKGHFLVGSPTAEYLPPPPFAGQRITIEEARAEVPPPLLVMFDGRVATLLCRFRLRGDQVYPELAFSATCGEFTAHYFTDGTRDDVLLAGVTGNAIVS